MRLFDLFENENTNLVVIYPGRFHPFHIGHGKVFKYLKQNFKGAQVFIASSGKTDTHKSPFTFDEKKKMMMLAGVDPNAVVQAKVPYVASEITDRFDPDTTVVVYAVSEKDMAEDPRFAFPQNGPKLKKNGEPAHVQKWTGMADAKPLRDHSYIVTVPTFTFKIQGEAINSATQIRNMIGKADEEKLTLILQDLYDTQNIPHEVMEIFKRKLQPSTMSESWEEPTVYECLLEAEYHRELLTERKLSGGEKRSKAAHFKKLNKHAKSDFVDRYGKDAESIMHAVATKRAKNESEDVKAFDPKTMNALNDLKVKYPHADNVMGALVADIEDSQKKSKQNDAEHDIQIADLEKKLDAITKELKQLKIKKESQMRISDIVSEEITLEDTQDFHEEFGYLAFSEDEGDLFEAEYQGRSVKLNKPMRGDVKKFKVYVKNDKGNVVKVNFGDPDMKIKKSNPKRRKSFRARHNCDNPGPKTKARYWSCRKW
jgi:glycerol-3-phosphate cytidylyltransferase-like family protein